MSGCFKIHILSNKMYSLTVTVNKKYYRYHTSFLFNNLFLVQYRILSYIILRKPGRLMRRPGRLMRWPWRSMRGPRRSMRGPGRSMRGPRRPMRGSGRSMREPGRWRWGRGREGQSSFFIFKPNRTKSYPILQYSLTNICTINHSLNSSEN